MKYMELAAVLRDLIDSGEENTQDGRFISERVICERYDVSRSTARKAVNVLCTQGYLLSIHGKGTYVKSCLQTQPLLTVTSCGQYYRSIGLHPTRDITCKEIIPASYLVAEKLKIKPDAPVYNLRMRYFADRMCLNETISYIPLSRFPDVQKIDFSTAPLLEILKQKYNAEAKRTETALEAILPNLKIAEDLSITSKTPLLLFDAVTSGILDRRMVPFEYFRCYYKTDMYRFAFVQEHDIIY